ncbi:Protein of unknown function [Singulisphaera sp. GP187]|uniref:glycosyltransferase family 87 protein n=1 Tax=Singulisphaera sp. GP187 TaxID=1882752 RepID=UPI00092B42A8|nr:glycosyltransferase family 87 protein [Singulisphaera sp. GP187]SIO46776.1 Protein of unknown function [Singulisphaera sp. GP187]
MRVEINGTGGGSSHALAAGHSGNRGADRRWLWVSLAFWVALIRGSTLAHNFQSPGGLGTDFFQEYASARNRVEGLPIYTSHLETIPRYLGTRTDQNRPFVVVNAHPPTSVLLALPFAGLGFDEAFRGWNVASLFLFETALLLVLHQLKVRITALTLISTTVILLMSDPFLEQIRLGQLNMVLLVFLTGAWAAERTGRPWAAGALLGAATAVKLFPGFLLLYYAMRGRWKVVGGGLLSATALTVLTAAVLGSATYVAYFKDVLPEIQWFRVGWNNVSLVGFWSRLLDPAPERLRAASRSDPLFYSPVMARIAIGGSYLAIVGLLAWATRRIRGRAAEDKAYGLAVTAMLLVCPITWEHYFLLLLVPFAVSWVERPSTTLGRGTLLAILACMWVSPTLFWGITDLKGRVARPIDSMTVLAVHTYTLLLFFLIGVVGLLREAKDADQPPGRRLPEWPSSSVGSPIPVGITASDERTERRAIPANRRPPIRIP